MALLLSNIEAEEYDVAVFYNIILAFRTDFALFACAYKTAAF